MTAKQSERVAARDAMKKTKQPRDMTQKEFDAALKRYGFGEPSGIFGYVDVGGGIGVSILNAGPRRRDQLAYLLQRKADLEKPA